MYFRHLCFFIIPTFFSQGGIDRDSKKNSFLLRKENSDCIALENDCAHCCSHGKAVNRKYQKEIIALIKANCVTYKGGRCDCVHDKKKWNVTCVKGSCEMKATPIYR